MGVKEKSVKNYRLIVYVLYENSREIQNKLQQTWNYNCNERVWIFAHYDMPFKLELRGGAL